MKQLVKIIKVKGNPNNPRIIKNDKFKKLVKSIQEFPEMLKLRPIVVDENMIVLGGNMRLKASKDAGLKEVWIEVAEGLTEEQKKEFIVKDNVGFGEWEWDMLANEWEVEDLENWGLNVPTIKNTELLSSLEYDPVYYEPKKKPKINLNDCIDISKCTEKIDALNLFDLTDEQKEILKVFAYRFIKIDFENVANYYEYNATEEEKKAIERLRLVLTDNGVNGFVEDDLIKIMGITNLDNKSDAIDYSIHF
jgi:hypothetical protein|tara:strand:+ start:198 stop:947 length:750 start_codon:yes stop_codon:yes gene_type:complete